MAKNDIFLSVVAPAYNEEKGISAVLNYWVEQLEIMEPNYEIIICDDGSRDKTWQVIEKFAKTNKKVKNIQLSKNQGAGAAHTAALKYSTGKWVLMLDSDGQFDIKDYLLMKKKQKETGADAVFGVRKVKQDSFLLRFGSSMSGKVANMLLGSKVNDFNSVFKLIRGDIARELPLDSKKFEVSTDSTAKLIESNAKIAEVIVSHNKREAGTSTLKVFRAARNRFAFVMYLNKRRRLIKKNIIQVKNYGPEGHQVNKGANWK